MPFVFGEDSLSKDFSEQGNYLSSFFFFTDISLLMSISLLEKKIPAT